MGASRVGVTNEAILVGEFCALYSVAGTRLRSPCAGFVRYEVRCTFG